MTLTEGSPRSDTEVYNDHEVPTLPLESDDGPIEGFHIKSEVGFFDFIKMTDSHPLDPPLALAQKRTFEDFFKSRLTFPPTDIKMPLLKRARFYKEQSVNNLLAKLEEVNGRLKEVEKKLEAQVIVNQEVEKKLEAQVSANQEVEKKFEEQVIVNQEVEKKFDEQVSANQELKKEFKDLEIKQLFLGDFLAIHNDYFLAQQRGVESQEEQRVLSMVINTMSEYQVESLVSSAQSLTAFLATLRGRLEMLIPERVTNAKKVDEEARCILIGVGCENLQGTANKYTRQGLGEELVAYFFKSCVQNRSQ